MARANRLSPRNAYAPLVEAAADTFDGADWRMAPIADLIARLWLAQGFLVSGIVKLASWPTTLVLYAIEHPVPGLSPTAASPSSTGATITSFSRSSTRSQRPRFRRPTSRPRSGMWFAASGIAAWSLAACRPSTPPPARY
jgi:hypothetical protein